MIRQIKSMTDSYLPRDKMNILSNENYEWSDPNINLKKI